MSLFSTNNQRAVSLVKEAELLAETDEIAQAIEKYRAACGLRNDMASWHARMSRLLGKLGQLEEALAEIDTALHLNAKAPAGWFIHQAQLLSKAGQVQAAIDAYRVGFEQGSGTAAWHAKLARLLQQTGKNREALEAYQEAVRLDASQPAWQAEIAMLSKLVDEGKSETAGSMSKERKADWYDMIYAKEKEYMNIHESSIYAEVWNRIVELLKEKRVESVLEVGCGSGQLARLIHEKIDHVNYRGFDFSEKAIELARQSSPSLSFTVGNALDRSCYSSGSFDLVLSTEVLEHIEDDLTILSVLPEGTRFLGTVPDFDSYSHVRFFRSQDEVRDRYGNYMKDFHVEEILAGQGRIFLFGGIIIKNPYG